MRILFPAGYFDPERYASRQLNLDMVTALAEAGHTVTVISPAPSRGVPKEPKWTRAEKKQGVLCGGKVEILRFPMLREGSNPVLRALRYLLCHLAQFFLASRCKSADLIFAVSTPPTQGALAALLKKRLRIPLVYQLQDVFPDSLVGAGLTAEGSLLWRIGRRIERFTYRNADRILVISEDFKENLRAKGVPERKIQVLPNWMDENTVVPVPPEENRLFEELELDRDAFLVTYAGNFGALQGLESLLWAAQLLREERDIRFLLFGSGMMEEKLRRLAAGLQLDNVRFFPLQSANRISEVYSLGDISVVSCKKGTGKSALPSKTWSILSAGRPVLAGFDADSGLCRLLRQENIGIRVPPEDPEALAIAIRQAYAQREVLAAMGARGRQYICKTLGRASGMDQFRKALEEAADGPDRLLWLGYGLSEARRQEIFAKGGALLSAHAVQTTLLQALRNDWRGPVYTVNLPGVPEYPAFPELLVRRDPWISDGETNCGVGYLNIKYVSALFKQRAVTKAVKRWSRGLFPGERPLILLYAMTSPFLLAAQVLKKRLPHAHIALIVPDLPEYMDLHMSLAKKLLKHLDARLIRHAQKAVDSWILFSEPMAEKLSLPEGSYLVMEGCVNPSAAEEPAGQSPPEKKVILYTGAYDLSYGIPELLEAFSQLKEPDTALWFAGSGPAEQLIEQSAQADPRIKNLGYLSDRNRLMSLQAQAALLVNLRDPAKPVFRYSFPSKLLEYLLSGVPVLTTQLPGIPEEYHPYLLTIPDNRPETIRDAMEQALALTREERDQLTAAARRFVLTQKTGDVQARRVLAFFSRRAGRPEWDAGAAREEEPHAASPA